jgi:hypothetical protein
MSNSQIVKAAGSIEALRRGIVILVEEKVAETQRVRPVRG